MRLLVLAACILKIIDASAMTPTLSIVKEISFGEIFGKSGICNLDYDTKVVSDLGGGLCPSFETKLGVPGQYIITGNSGTSLVIHIKSRPDSGDGLTFTPSGIFEVYGQADIPILTNQDQVVPTGDTGVVTIRLGGTLRAIFDQSFNDSISIEMIEGITFNEQP
jgi:hypothetical protein